MRYVYLVLVIAFTALVLLFKVQNIEQVTVTLFTASLTLPLSLLLVGVYVLGMVTGSFVVALLRGWWQGARPRPAPRP
jgi:uncharacterized integral membrane protein